MVFIRILNVWKTNYLSRAERKDNLTNEICFAHKLVPSLLACRPTSPLFAHHIPSIKLFPFKNTRYAEHPAYLASTSRVPPNHQGSIFTSKLINIVAIPSDLLHSSCERSPLCLDLICLANLHLSKDQGKKILPQKIALFVCSMTGPQR